MALQAIALAAVAGIAAVGVTTGGVYLASHSAPFTDGDRVDSELSPPGRTAPATSPGEPAASPEPADRGSVVTVTGRDHVAPPALRAEDAPRQLTDGAADVALFNGPTAVAFRGENELVVSDFENAAIRLVDAAGSVRTLAGGSGAGYRDGPAHEAQFYGPSSIAIDKSGDIFVSDGPNNRIRKVASDGTVTTVAGSGPTGLGSGGFLDGPALAARLNSPAGIAFDARGNLIIAEKDNHRIRVLTIDGEVRTLAGTGEEGLRDGPAAEARFAFPVGVAIDSAGNIFITEHGNNAIRRIGTDGYVTTLVHSNQPSIYGQVQPGALAFPSGIAVGPDGALYVANVQGHEIFRVEADGSAMRAVAGTGQAGYADGDARFAQFWSPTGVAVDGSGDLIIADSGNHRIRKLTLK